MAASSYAGPQPGRGGLQTTYDTSQGTFKNGHVNLTCFRTHTECMYVLGIAGGPQSTHSTLGAALLSIRRQSGLSPEIYEMEKEHRFVINGRAMEIPSDYQLVADTYHEDEMLEMYDWDELSDLDEEDLWEPPTWLIEELNQLTI